MIQPLEPAGQLRIRGLTKTFRDGGHVTTVLDDLSLELRGGQSLAIVGSSGSGKSTLLHLIGGLEPADAGSVQIDDVEITSLGGSELARFRNRNVGFVFQDHHLLPHLNVLDNVLVPVLATSKVTADDTDRARQLIESVGLSDRIHHVPSRLSGGQRERVALVRAMMMRPRLILADEPTGNLDAATADVVAEELIGLSSRHGVMLIVVTHDHRLAAKMDQSMKLMDGRLGPGGTMMR